MRRWNKFTIYYKMYIDFNIIVSISFDIEILIFGKT